MRWNEEEEKVKMVKFKPRICEVDKDGGVWWQVTPDRVTRILKEKRRIKQ